MKIIVSMLLIVFLFISCNSSINNQYDSDAILDSELLTISDVRGDFEFIALDDSSLEAILPDVWNVRISDEYIFVLSAQAGVFQFSRKGDYIRRISQKGNGPGEWSTIIDIAVDDSDDKIYLYDFAGKILSFSILDGEYIEQYQFPGKLFSKIHVWNNNLLIAPYNSIGNEEHMIYSMDIEGTLIKSTGSLSSFVLSDYNQMLYSFTKGIIDINDRIFIHPNLSNTIYEYFPESNTIEEILSILSKDPLTPDLIGQGYEGMKQAQSITDFAKNGQFFFVKICNYNINGEWYAFDNIDNEIYKLFLKYEQGVNLQFSPKYQSGGLVVDLINVNSLEDNSLEMLFLSDKVGKKISSCSNPIIVIWNE